jgi:hypothetical protein
VRYIAESLPGEFTGGKPSIISGGPALSRKTWTLTDLDADVFVEHLDLCPEHAGGPAKGVSVVKRTLRGGPRDGVDVVEVNNGLMRFVVVPTRGMGLHHATCGEMRLGWRSPVAGPVHPALVNLWQPNGIGWLDGFDELLVRCGLESNGAPEYLPNGALRWPLHGKIANTPARKLTLSIDGDSGEISVVGVVDEARLFGNKMRLISTVSTRVGQPWLTVTDEVVNLSAAAGELELLYHINFGPPLAAPGASVMLPFRRMAPRDAAAAAELEHWNLYGAETPGAPELCYFFEPAADPQGNAQTLLRSPDGRFGASVRFNARQLPCFTLWKNRHAVADGYVTGLEPAINYPNVRSFEERQGRVATLSPGESRRFELTLIAHVDAAAVAKAEAEISAVQSSAAGEVMPQPNPQWSSC